MNIGQRYESNNNTSETSKSSLNSYNRILLSEKHGKNDEDNDEMRRSFHNYNHGDLSHAIESFITLSPISSVTPILSRNTALAMHLLARAVPAALEEASRRHRTAPDIAGSQFRLGLIDARYLPLFVNYMYEFLLSAVWNTDAALQWRGCTVAAVPRPFPMHNSEHPGRDTPSPVIYPHLPPYPANAVDLLLLRTCPGARSPAYSLPFAEHYERLYRTKQWIKTGAADGIPVQAELSIKESDQGQSLAHRLSVPEFDLLRKIVPTEYVAETRRAALKDIPTFEQSHLTHSYFDNTQSGSRLAINKIHPNSLAHTARTVAAAPEPVHGVRFTPVSVSDTAIYMRHLDMYLRKWNFGIAVQHTLQISTRSAVFAGFLSLISGCFRMIKNLTSSADDKKSTKWWKIARQETILTFQNIKQTTKTAAARGFCIGLISSTLCLHGMDPVLQESISRITGTLFYQFTFNSNKSKLSFRSTLGLLKEEILTELLQQGAQYYILPWLYNNFGNTNDGILAWHSMAPFGALLSIPIYTLCRFLGKYL